jgi:flagella basal body P-ring formation protein FlgA
MVVWSLLWSLTMGNAAAEAADSLVLVSNQATLPAQSTIRLGDVARITGLPRRDSEILAGIELGRTGARGSRRTVSRVDILRAIRREGRGVLSASNPVLRIPAQITITTPENPLTVEMIQQVVDQQWRPLCEPCEVQISSVQLPVIAEQLAADGLRLRPEPNLPKGAFRIPLEIADTAGGARVAWVTGRLDVYKSVPVTVRAIAPGESLDAASVRLEKRNITFATDGVSTLEQVVGQRARSSLAVGQIVWPGQLQRQLAFRRGDIVRLITGDSNLEVSVTGQAEQDGVMGDPAKIKNFSSGKFVSGVVSGKNEVRIE